MGEGCQKVQTSLKKKKKKNHHINKNILFILVTAETLTTSEYVSFETVELKLYSPSATSANAVSYLMSKKNLWKNLEKNGVIFF